MSNDGHVMEIETETNVNSQRIDNLKKDHDIVFCENVMSVNRGKILPPTWTLVLQQFCQLIRSRVADKKQIYSVETLIDDWNNKFSKFPLTDEDCEYIVGILEMINVVCIQGGIILSSNFDSFDRYLNSMIDDRMVESLAKIGTTSQLNVMEALKNVDKSDDIGTQTGYIVVQWELENVQSRLNFSNASYSGIYQIINSLTDVNEIENDNEDEKEIETENGKDEQQKAKNSIDTMLMYGLKNKFWNARLSFDCVILRDGKILVQFNEQYIPRQGCGAIDVLKKFRSALKFCTQCKIVGEIGCLEMRKESITYISFAYDKVVYYDDSYASQLYLNDTNGDDYDSSSDAISSDDCKGFVISINSSCDDQLKIPKLLNVLKSGGNGSRASRKQGLIECSIYSLLFVEYSLIESRLKKMQDFIYSSLNSFKLNGQYESSCTMIQIAVYFYQLFLNFFSVVFDKTYPLHIPESFFILPSNENDDNNDEHDNADITSKPFDFGHCLYVSLIIDKLKFGRFIQHCLHFLGDTLKQSNVASKKNLDALNQFKRAVKVQLKRIM